QQRVFWCVATGLVAIALLVGGGMASLQALTIAVGLPFCLVLLVMCASLYKGLAQEPRPA
ncbi:MAG: BCCT family betaine/carnitine transporter, partial [Candidatus Azotimanducaceae bacterium]